MEAAMAYVVTEFLGDGISAELRRSVHTVLNALPVQFDVHPVDLSLESRTINGTQIFDQAYESISQTKYAIKYPTITETESPNAILRRLCQFSVIHRPVFSIPGVKSNFKQKVDWTRAGGNRKT